MRKSRSVVIAGVYFLISLPLARESLIRMVASGNYSSGLLKLCVCGVFSVCAALSRKMQIAKVFASCFSWNIIFFSPFLALSMHATLGNNRKLIASTIREVHWY